MAEDDKHEPTCCEKFGTGLSNFFKFLYNNETGQVMGRSGVSWAKIGFFYLIFYGFLAGFFSGMLAVFLSTLEDPDKGGAPKLTQYVANQPGLSRLDERLGKALKFNYNVNDTVLVSNYSTMIRGFLNKYSGPIYKDKPACSPNQTAEAGMGKDLCCYNTTEFLGKCNGVQDPYFGLKEGKPCYFIRMNKVYNWVPKSKDGSGFLKLECKDKYDKQVPEVIPKGGFLINAFPFRGQDGFELPVVAVKIDVKKNPEEIDCVLVGKDIEVSTSFVPSRAYGKIRIK